MPTRITPPLYARGLYDVAAPWALTPATVYVCAAIRSFNDLYEQGIDVYEEFYVPMGFADEAATLAAFEADQEAKAAIITLRAEDNSEYIYIPDTYINAYPGQDDVKYSHMVLSASLGPLPDYLDLTVAKDAVETKMLEILGVTAVVKEHRAASKDSISPSNHATLETTRQNNLSLQETDFARAERLVLENAELQQQVDSLRQILEDEGYAQP